MNKKNIISKLIVVLIAIVYLCLNFNTTPKNILSWDVFGYYLYLPLTFIYQDLGLDNVSIIHSVIEKYNNTSTFYQAMPTPEGGWVMKYSMGIALLYLPFFLIGHSIALLADLPADGFSTVYQVSIAIGSFIYTIIGIFLTRILLLKFFKDKIVSFLLIILAFGTNYFFHTSFHGQNAMSHNYLFTLYIIIILLTIKWHLTNQLKHIVLLGIVCGLTILSRPSEVVCLLIPFLWGVNNKNSLFTKFNLFVKYKYQIALFSIILLFIGSFQLIYWKIFTGKFIYYSYGGNAGEGFEFSHPYILEVLFSFRKGWLLYTPIMLFSLIGFIFLYKRNKPIFYSIFLYAILNLYIVSSWSCWWYAESFSQRSLIQSYAVLIIPLGYFIQYIFSRKNSIKGVFYTIIILLIGLNVFQTWQFNKKIIHGSRMTKDYYISTFGKTSVTEEDKNKLLIDRSFDGEENFANEEEFKSKILEIKDFESEQTNNTTLQYAYSGKTSYLLGENQNSFPIIEASYAKITDQSYAWIRCSVMVYPVSEINKKTSSFIVCFEHNGYNYKHKRLDLESLNLKLNEWNKVTVDYLTPEVRNKQNKLKVFVEHLGNDKLFIDDLKVEIYELK